MLFRAFSAMGFSSGMLRRLLFSDDDDIFTGRHYRPRDYDDALRDVISLPFSRRLAV